MTSIRPIGSPVMRPWARPTEISTLGIPGWLKALSASAVIGWDFRTDQRFRLEPAGLVRSSSKTMLLASGERQLFAANVLARVDGVGASLERAATQLTRNSEDIAGTGWSALPPQLTKTGNATAGFTLTVNADISATHLRIEQYSAWSIPVNVPGYFSFDLHDSGLRGASVWFSNIGYQADFDTSTGTAVGAASAMASMSPIGGGWWRCEIVHTQTAAPNIAWRIKVGKSRNDTNYLVGQFIRLRAPQVELDRLSSYIPNASTSATAARAADALTLALNRPGNHVLKALLGDGSIQTLAASASVAFAIDPAALNQPTIRAIWGEAA